VDALALNSEFSFITSSILRNVCIYKTCFQNCGSMNQRLNTTQLTVKAQF